MHYGSSVMVLRVVVIKPSAGWAKSVTVVWFSYEQGLLSVVEINAGCWPVDPFRPTVHCAAQVQPLHAPVVLKGGLPIFKEFYNLWYR
jgi:hypothetical protein